MEMETIIEIQVGRNTWALEKLDGLAGYDYEIMKNGKKAGSFSLAATHQTPYDQHEVTGADNPTAIFLLRVGWYEGNDSALQSVAHGVDSPHRNREQETGIGMPLFDEVHAELRRLRA